MKGGLCWSFLTLVALSTAGRDGYYKTEDGSSVFIATRPGYYWFDAACECAKRNMTLITIDSQHKEVQIYRLLESIGFGGFQFYTGANNIANMRNYKWLSTENFIEYSNWISGEPKYGDLYCLVIDSESKWFTFKCGFKSFFICEENAYLQQTNADESKDLLFDFHQQLKSECEASSSHDLQDRLIKLLKSDTIISYVGEVKKHLQIENENFKLQLNHTLAAVENTTKQLGEIQEFLVTNVTKEAQQSAGMLEDFIRQEREKLEESQELLFGNLTKEAQHSVRLAELIQEEKKLREEIQQRLDMHLNGEAQNSARMMEELVEEVNEMRHSLAKDAFKIELMEELMQQQKTQLEENQKVLEIQLTVETQNSARMVEELVQEVDEMRNNLAKEAHNTARLQELILQQTKQLEDNQKLWDKHLTEDTQNSTQRVEELVQEVNEMRNNLTKEAQHSARLYQQQHNQLEENLKLLEKRLNEEAQTSVRMVEGLAQELNEMRHNLSTQLTKEAQNSARLEELIQQQKTEFEENHKFLENHLIDEAHNSGHKINELAQEIKEIRNELRNFHTFQNVAERQFAFIDSLNLKENFNATSYTANLKSKNDHIEDLRKTIKQLESRLAEYGKSQNCTAPKNFYFVQRGQP